MKKIYEFVLPKSQEVDETTIAKKDGKEVKTITKVTKSVDHRFFLKKPTRKLYDEAELFYGVRLSEGIKAGLLTRALLAKRFSNDGGVLSDQERAEFGELYSDTFDKQVELQALNLKTREQRTAEENRKHDEVTVFLENSRKRIQEFETNQSSLFDQTAENRARNKTILWWVLQLSHELEGKDEEAPFFGAGEYEEKIDRYDSMEEEDEEWVMEVINKFFYYVSFWYVSKTNDPEQFRALIKFAEQADLGDDLSRHEVEFEDEEAIDEVPAEAGEAAEPEKAPKKAPKKARRRRKVKTKETPAKVAEVSAEEPKEKETVDKVN